MPKPSKKIFYSPEPNPNPLAPVLRTQLDPTSVLDWVEHPLTEYTLDGLLIGAHHYINLNVMANLKNSAKYEINRIFTKPFDKTAHLGQKFAHLEAGKLLARRYQKVKRAGELLGPVSGPHISVIAEYSRVIEQWYADVSWNFDDGAEYFRDWSSYSKFLEMLEGSLSGAINDVNYLIFSMCLLADPTRIILGHKEISRVYGRTKDNPTQTSPWTADFDRKIKEVVESDKTKGRQTSRVSPDSPERKWADLSDETRQHYEDIRKSLDLYFVTKLAVQKNFRPRNPYLWSSNREYEEQDKTEVLYIDPSSYPGKDVVTIFMQRLYTDCHSPEAKRAGKCLHLKNLNRFDCLIDLYYDAWFIANVVTRKPTFEFCWENDSYLQPKTKAEIEKITQLQMQQGVTGSVVEDVSNQHAFARPLGSAHATNSNSEGGFEVMCEPENLIMVMNPEDYIELKAGVHRRGPDEVRVVSLDGLKDLIHTIIPHWGMKPGFFTIMDIRSLEGVPYFNMADLVTPAQKLTYRSLLHNHTAFCLWNKYVGVTSYPSPHFVASAYFYSKYQLIGSPIEDSSMTPT